jgi:hypothetical protein
LLGRLCDHRDRLHAGGSGADHTHPLAAKVDAQLTVH